jgi:hypothetical protein
VLLVIAAMDAKRRPRALERLSHRLIVAAVAFGQPLKRPALAVQPNGLVDPLCWDALPPQLNSGPPQVRRHGRPVHVPAGGNRLHVVTCLVLHDQFLDLFGCQPALSLSRLRELGWAWPAAADEVCAR